MKNKRNQYKETIVSALEGCSLTHTPQEIAVRWEINTDDGGSDYFRVHPEDNIRDLVLNAFSWDGSPEGYSYWAKVDECYSATMEEWQNEALEVTEVKETNGNFEVN